MKTILYLLQFVVIIIERVGVPFSYYEIHKKTFLYKQHPTRNNVKRYVQLNINPVIIKNGNLTSDREMSSWYNGFSFLNCSGIFDSVS